MYLNVHDDSIHFDLMIILTKRFMIPHLNQYFPLIIIPIEFINQIVLDHLIIMF